MKQLYEVLPHAVRFASVSQMQYRNCIKFLLHNILSFCGLCNCIDAVSMQHCDCVNAKSIMYGSTQKLSYS